MLEKADGQFDPQRCQGVTEHGQCPNKGKPIFCPICGPTHEAKRNRRKYDLRLAKLIEKHEHQMESDSALSLREELSLVRLTLQSTIDEAVKLGENGFFVYTDRIDGLIERARRVTDTCVNLEAKTGFVIDKSKVMLIADGIVNILSEHIKDGEKLSQIASEITVMIGKMSSNNIN